MRELAPREKRTIRIAAVIIAVYLVCFAAFKGWRHLEAKRNEYARVQSQVATVNAEYLRELGKARKLERLQKSWGIDLASFSKPTLVSEARAAIEAAAGRLGFGVGSLKETQGRTSAGELRVFHIEGEGAATAAVNFIHALRTLGYPLVLDHASLTTKGKKPGVVGLSLTIAVLDYSSWKGQT